MDHNQYSQILGNHLKHLVYLLNLLLLNRLLLNQHLQQKKPETQKAARDNRRRGAPTFCSKPGKRFLTFVPSAQSDKESILNCLKTWMSKKKADDDEFLIDSFLEKYTSLSEEHGSDKALSLTCLWLYTIDNWPYKRINEQLREDGPGLEVLSPIINALLNAYNFIGETNWFYSGTVYRSTRLSATQLSLYKPSETFVWSSFTSTTTEYDVSGQFGPIVFIIKIPDNFKKSAINLESLSAFQDEQEVLLLPNVGYIVEKIDTPSTLPNSTTSITVKMMWISITM